jgi:aminocarboxymuconate-semialdehyde decarboxylase
VLSTGQAVDVHAHLVPPALLDEAERQPSLFGGVEVARTPEGPVVTFPGGAPLRPIKPPMLGVEQRRAWLREHGLASQIVGAWMDATGDLLPAEAQIAWTRRFNEELARMCGETSRQVRGLATLPLQRPEQAARELEYAVRELGLLGAMIGTDVARIDLADAALDPLWSAARDLGVPLVLHPTFTGPGAGLQPRSFVNLYGRTIDTTYLATRLILAGLFDRQPGLALVLVHGGGFLPYQAERLDTCFQAGDLGAVSLQRGLPSAYLSCFHYDTALISAPAVKLLVEAVGSERVMLGTDYPFPIADRRATERLSAALPDEPTLQQVLQGNAERLFPTRV